MDGTPGMAGGVGWGVFPDAASIAVTFAAVLLTTFMKGAFGGGFAIVGIPLMALAMDPIAAGAVLAVVFCLSDIAAFRYWRPSTWSKQELSVLIPGQLMGVALGYVAMSAADRRVVAIAIGTITLGFAGLWFLGGGRVEKRPRSNMKGVLAGMGSGMGSMIAHAGGPPVAMYLLPLGLPKSQYAGTTFMFFWVGNLLKVGPWLALAGPSRELWALIGLSLPVIVVGVWSGWYFHERVDDQRIYRTCYMLLVAVALKLLWDGLRGYA